MSRSIAADVRRFRPNLVVDAPEAEGPFPEHYEPFETPIGTNPLHPKVVSNPAARVFKGDMESFGKADEFPYAATTYRLTEHLHFWTKHSKSNAVTQPAPFVEIGDAEPADPGTETAP